MRWTAEDGAGADVIDDDEDAVAVVTTSGHAVTPCDPDAPNEDGVRLAVVPAVEVQPASAADRTAGTTVVRTNEVITSE